MIAIICIINNLFLLLLWWTGSFMGRHVNGWSGSCSSRASRWSRLKRLLGKVQILTGPHGNYDKIEKIGVTLDNTYASTNFWFDIINPFTNFLSAYIIYFWNYVESYMFFLSWQNELLGISTCPHVSIKINLKNRESKTSNNNISNAIRGKCR